jgi:hypothetical protein
MSFTWSLSFTAPYRNPVSFFLLPRAYYKPHSSYSLHLFARMTFGKRTWPKTCGKDPAGSAPTAELKVCKVTCCIARQNGSTWKLDVKWRVNVMKGKRKKESKIQEDNFWKSVSFISFYGCFCLLSLRTTGSEKVMGERNLVASVLIAILSHETRERKTNHTPKWKQRHICAQFSSVQKWNTACLISSLCRLWRYMGEWRYISIYS